MSLLWRHSRDTASVESGQALNSSVLLCKFTGHSHRRDDKEFGGEGALLERVAPGRDNRSLRASFLIDGLGTKLVHSKVRGGVKHG